MDKISYFNKEYNYIKDDRLKENIKKIVDLLPDYFFTVPASSTGKYHPKFASSENGLLKHSKVACKIGYELMNNNSLGHKFTDKEKDLLIILSVLLIVFASKAHFTSPLIVIKLFNPTSNS